MLSRFHLIPERHGRTDGQTDRQNCYINIARQCADARYKRFQMSSRGCGCGLATNVLWKAVPGSRTCIREGLLVKLGMCPRHDIVRSGR